VPSLIYMSFPDDQARGAIDMDTDTFRMMLVTSAYTENQDTHTKRSDVTNEVTGTGYSAGGATTTVTVTKSTGANTVTLTFSQVQWNATGGALTARKAVVYKSRGGAATADELVFVNDFGSDVTATNDLFTVPQSTITFTVP
jgi:hypothetical protein